MTDFLVQKTLKSSIMCTRVNIVCMHVTTQLQVEANIWQIALLIFTP